MAYFMCEDTQLSHVKCSQKVCVLVCQECRVPNYSESVKCSKHQIIRVYVLSVDLWFSITISDLCRC